MPFKIGILGIEDPRSVKTCSGSPYHLAHFLREAGHEVRSCGPYPLRYPIMLRAIKNLSRTVLGNHVVLERHPWVSRRYAGIVDGYAAANPDLDLFLATSVFYVDKRKTSIPIVAWGDTTVAGVLGSYPYYSNLSSRMIEQSHRVEQRGLDACDHVIFSNHWAAKVALEHYNLSASKVSVITYGANILRHPSRVQLEEVVKKRIVAPLKAILVGVDWRRKGVDKAIETIAELRRDGIEIALRVVGCTPPPGSYVPDYVEVFGRIPKDTPEGEQRYYELLESSHVFLLPTVAECAAVSMAEANAYGLPVIVSNVGGNGSLVIEGVNGYLCGVDAPARVWARALKAIVMQPDAYRDQCFRAQAYYERELSWEVAVERFGQLVQSAFQDSEGVA